MSRSIKHPANCDRYLPKHRTGKHLADHKKRNAASRELQQEQLLTIVQSAR